MLVITCPKCGEYYDIEIDLLYDYRCGACDHGFDLEDAEIGDFTYT